MEKRIIVCGIVCNNNEVLLGRKSKGRPPYPDVWHTLGGGVSDNDKATQLLDARCYDDLYFHDELRRELKEEAGIKILDPRNICPKYRDKPREAVTKNKHGIETCYTFLEFLCNLDPRGGIGQPGDDIVELQWIKKENLKKVQLTSPSQKMYQELGWL